MNRRIFRFVFPFLFIRNWHDGSWELSRARCILVVTGILLIFLSLVIAYILQAPAVYIATP
jgi:hypothetical protein